MDETPQLTKFLNQPLVEERDTDFAAIVRERALRQAKWRRWIFMAVTFASVLALAVTLEEMRRAAVTALAPALAAATADSGLLMHAPIGLTLATVALFIAGLASFRL